MSLYCQSDNTRGLPDISPLLWVKKCSKKSLAFSSGLSSTRFVFTLAMCYPRMRRAISSMSSSLGPAGSIFPLRVLRLRGVSMSTVNVDRNWLSALRSSPQSGCMRCTPRSSGKVKGSLAAASRIASTRASWCAAMMSTSASAAAIPVPDD